MTESTTSMKYAMFPPKISEFTYPDTSAQECRFLLDDFSNFTFCYKGKMLRLSPDKMWKLLETLGEAE